jgi:hypothetical protein
LGSTDSCPDWYTDEPPKEVRLLKEGLHILARFESLRTFPPKDFRLLLILCDEIETDTEILSDQQSNLKYILPMTWKSITNKKYKTWIKAIVHFSNFKELALFRSRNVVAMSTVFGWRWTLFLTTTFQENPVNYPLTSENALQMIFGALSLHVPFTPLLRTYGEDFSVHRLRRLS